MTERETRLDPRLASDLRRLSQTGIEPPRDLWPELERQLRSRNRRPTRRRFRHLALAAAVLVAMLAGVTWRLTRPDAAFQSIATHRSIAAPSITSSPEFQTTFARYSREREQILESIIHTLADYPPELTEGICQSIEEIDRAMQDIERSIRRGSSLDETRLAELYDLEVRLLGTVRDRLRGETTIGGVS